jgi:hypothetical protein
MLNCLDLKEEIGFERGQKKHEAQTLKDSPVSFLRCQKGNRGLGVDLLYPLNFFLEAEANVEAQPCTVA